MRRACRVYEVSESGPEAGLAEMVEDLLDAMTVAIRRDEPTVPFEEVVAKLRAAGKLDGGGQELPGAGGT